MARSGLTELARLLKARKKSIYTTIGEAGVSQIKQNFDNETDPYNDQKWAGLSDVTEARRKGDGDYKILQDTANAKNAISYKTAPNMLVFGLPKSYRYMETHQFGAKKGQYGVMRNGLPIPWGDIPQRRFMGLNTKARKILLGEYEDMIKDIINEVAK